MGPHHIVIHGPGNPQRDVFMRCIKCMLFISLFTLKDKPPDSRSKCTEMKFKISLATRCVSHLKAGMSERGGKRGRVAGCDWWDGQRSSSVLIGWEHGDIVRQILAPVFDEDRSLLVESFLVIHSFWFTPLTQKQRPAVCWVSVMDR